MKKFTVLIVIMFILSSIRAQNLTEIYSGPGIIDDIAITNDGAIYSVGEKIIIIKNGQTFEYWPPVELFSVFPISANEAWAVGNSAILHYNGSSWSSLTNPAGGCLYRVWGIDGNIYITGRNGTTSFLLKLVSGSFVKKAEEANSLFLGMNGYSSEEIFIAGSYTDTVDLIERPAIYIWDGDTAVYRHITFYNYPNLEGMSFNQTAKTFTTNTSGAYDYAMTITDHYFGGNDLVYHQFWGWYPISAYSGIARSVCSSPDGLTFMANGNGIYMVNSDSIGQSYQTLLTEQNCFDVEYFNNEVYILVDRTTIKKFDLNITLIDEFRPKPKSESTGLTEFYNLSGQKISGLNKNFPAGIYLKKTGNKVEKIHYLGE